MVDGQFAPLHDKIKAAIAAISPLPIKYLINTHFHGDHTGGNAGFQNEGATVVAQDNVRVRLAAGTVNGLTGIKTPPVAIARPSASSASAVHIWARAVYWAWLLASSVVAANRRHSAASLRYS
jgi:glyoxylase-like metal-dependent hydrolase (beta-lactamase superfamily II)